MYHTLPVIIKHDGGYPSCYSQTVGRRDAAAERTGMYLQRVCE